VPRSRCCGDDASRGIAPAGALRGRVCPAPSAAGED
jgi:hypothetical protein